MEERLAQLGHPGGDRREVAQACALGHVRAGPSRQHGVVHERVGTERRPSPASAHAPAEQDVLAQFDAPPRAQPALEAAHPLERRAGDQEVRGLVQAALGVHPQRAIEGPGGRSVGRADRALDQVGVRQRPQAGGQPAAGRDAVRIQEGQCRGARGRRAQVAGRGRAVPPSGQDPVDDGRGAGPLCGRVARGVVDHHHLEPARDLLLGQAGEGGVQRVLRVAGGDDDGDRGQAASLRGRPCGWGPRLVGHEPLADRSPRGQPEDRPAPRLDEPGQVQPGVQAGEVAHPPVEVRVPRP